MCNNNLDERKLRVEFFFCGVNGFPLPAELQGYKLQKMQITESVPVLFDFFVLVSFFFLSKLLCGPITIRRNNLRSVFLCVFSLIDDKLRHINIVRYIHCQSGCGNHVTLASD